MGFLAHSPLPTHGPPMENPRDLLLLLINSAQLVALAALLRISWKYLIKDVEITFNPRDEDPISNNPQFIEVGLRQKFS